ncbi:MAG: 4Fe-4S binding protein [Candidatus Helarchaeota archaeon]
MFKTVLNPKFCVNCRGCINQCPTNAIFLAPETEAAKKSFEDYFAMKNKNKLSGYA